MSDHDHVRHGRAGHGDHTGHAHGVSASADRRWLTVALALIGCFMAVEVAVGLISGSLALLADAAHMLTDAGSIVLALAAARLAARPARGSYTYGLKRAEVLSAQANGLTLLLLALWLGYESVRRLISPPEVEGALVVATALAGIVVNLAATWCISKANRTSLNVEGAFQHILNDLYAFIGTAIAGVIVLTTGFLRADAIAGLVVVLLMVKAGYGLLRAAGRVVLEAAPADTDPDAIGDHMAEQSHVAEIHDLHLWEITSGQPALSAHVLVDPGSDCHAIRRTLEELLKEDYDITHTTLQVDHLTAESEEGLLQIGRTADRPVPHGEEIHGPVHRPGPHTH
ncbi:cation diffusion facilitator family transporter [Streptomyces spirodelae]|uniref:Cation transporter n=1 Tax=Streptomyces spirodelae TaxID=2812904 RepID=A0ABS3WTV8_9ACTN|nr:cation diffusion facilitator family transporter [Streptomyces spirodelae]MBO8186474.1 cation transporter [Streptomyces spirodelae]